MWTNDVWLLEPQGSYQLSQRCASLLVSRGFNKVLHEIEQLRQLDHRGRRIKAACDYVEDQILNLRCPGKCNQVFYDFEEKTCWVWGP